MAQAVVEPAGAAGREEAGEAHLPERVRINRLGLWLFFCSDALLFALFAAARFYVAGTHTPEELNQALGLLITSILLASSLTAYRAETAMAHGDLRHANRMLLATIALGAVFLVGVGFEWSIAHFTPREAYGTAFFSMTGMHAFHVATGVLFLGFIFALGRGGRYMGARAWPVSATVMYWHFVDVVWVFFYPTLYLLR